MAHPSGSHFERASAAIDETSFEMYMNMFQGPDSIPMGLYPLSRTATTQTGLADQDGRGNGDCSIRGVGRNNVAADNTMQSKGKLVADDGLSQEEALHVLLSFKAVQPENAAWTVTAAQPDVNEEECPALLDHGAHPRKVHRRKQKVGRPRSSPSWPYSSSQRPLGGGGGTGQVCDNCGTTETPLWRKLKGTDRVNCNACGIYFNTKGRVRDPTVKHTRGLVKKSSPDKVKPRSAAVQIGSLSRRSSDRLRHAATRQNGEEDMLHEADAHTHGLEAALAPPAMPGLPGPQNLSFNNASHPYTTTHRHPRFSEKSYPPSYYQVMGDLMRSAVVAGSAL